MAVRNKANLLDEEELIHPQGDEAPAYDTNLTGLKKRTSDAKDIRDRGARKSRNNNTNLLESPDAQDRILTRSPQEKREKYDLIHRKNRTDLLEPTNLPRELSLVTTPNAGREVDIEEDQGLDVDVMDFLFGGEMAVVGLKYDNSGFHHDWESAKQQWSEEPLWLNLLNTTSLVGGMAFPLGRAAWAFKNVGRGASLLKRTAGITKADEVARFKNLGLLHEAEKIEDVGESGLKRLRNLEISQNKTQDLAEKLNKNMLGETEDFTLMDKVKMQFASRFTNNYFKLTSEVADGGETATKAFHNNLDSLFKAENFGKFFSEAPDAAAGKKIYAHWVNKMRPGLIKGAASLTPSELKWADGMELAMRSHQADALKHGLITDDTIKKVGELHIPALDIKTPRPDVSVSRKYVPLGHKDGETFLRAFDMPRLDSKSLKPRGKDLPEVAQRLMNGELITDPTELTTRGLIMDRLLLNNYKTVRDIATNSEFAVSARDVMFKYGSIRKAEAAGFVSLETLEPGIATTLKRMIKKSKPDWLDDADELPMIKKSVFEDLFAPEGIFGQTQMAANAFDVATAIFKTAKTALSPPTHLQNLASNFVMLSQAGFNPLKPRNIRLQSKMAGAFEKIAIGEKLRKEGGVGKKGIENLGINLGKIDIDGKVFNLNDEIFDPEVLKLLEESAFESVEGFSNLKNMVDSLRPEQRATKALGEGFLKAKKALQLGDKEGFRWFDQMTKAYLAEDMVPKMSYYMSLRAEGLTKKAAILEVGRRLPMYQTVGSSIRQGRKWAFPWLTFPTEAVRITKNNLMDHPLRMMPWLQMPDIIQSALTLSGQAPGADDVEETKRQLPMWAQKSETVVAGEHSGAIGGGITGALVGGVAGAIKGGGAGGAAIGAGLGAAAGAGFGFATETDDDRLRGTVLDWLPHAAFMLGSTSPEMGGDILPFKDIGGALEQSPAAPFAILKPLIEIMEGKTSWGTDIGVEDTGDYFSKALAGYIGFVSPPIIQKYGFKTTTPDVSASLALTGKSAPGDITNISRLLVDSGIAVDPISGKPGNLSTDLFLKNFGIWKSWAADPAQRLANEETTERHFQKIRSTVSKNLAYHLENGNDKESKRLLTVVFSTFAKQHTDNPREAQAKYSKWVESKMNSIGKHPRLRGWSEAELKARHAEASRFAGKERGRAREEMLDFLGKQVEQRQVTRAQAERMKASQKKDLL